MSCWLSASGPITAVFFDGSSGSRPFEFFSSTIERLAALRAAARSASVTKLASSFAFATSTYGCSKSPARNLIRRMRRTASLTREIGTRPERTSSTPLSRIIVLTISESVPALIAFAAASGAVGRRAVPARALVGVDRRARPRLGDGGVVALDEAVEAPLALEDVRLDVAVRAPRHAVERVEGAHDRVRAGVDRGLERRQVQVPQPRVGHVGRVVVAPALRLAVGGVVLDARDDLVLARSSHRPARPSRAPRRTPSRGTGPRPRPRRSGPSAARARRRPSGCRSA